MRAIVRPSSAVMAAAILALAFAAPATHAAAQTSVSALPDCAGKPQTRPAQVMFACGDGNFVANKLKWTGWGDTFAAATGTGSMNDCTPNCAAGHFHSAPIVVIASGRQTCPDGRAAYATLTWACIGKPLNVDADPHEKFPCK